MALDVSKTLSWFNPNITDTCDNYNIRGMNLPPTISDVMVDSRIYYGKSSITWYDASFDNLSLNKMSATCYYFARNLYDMGINGDTVPIGIIDSSKGGSIIESWISENSQNACDWRYCENYDGNQNEGIYSEQQKAFNM